MSNISIPFDDEFVGGHLAELLALKIDKSIITNEQVVQVVKILKLYESDVAQLQAKRNSVVKLLTENDHDEAAWATMSGVTCVIDSCMLNAGGIV